MLDCRRWAVVLCTIDRGGDLKMVPLSPASEAVRIVGPSLPTRTVDTSESTVLQTSSRNPFTVAVKGWQNQVQL